MADEDTRRLIAISIKKLENNLWSIDIDDGESYKVEGSFDEIKRALRRIKAKDGCEHGKCRSSKICKRARKTCIVFARNEHHKSRKRQDCNVCEKFGVSFYIFSIAP